GNSRIACSYGGSASPKPMENGPPMARIIRDEAVRGCRTNALRTTRSGQNKTSWKILTRQRALIKSVVSRFIRGQTNNNVPANPMIKDSDSHRTSSSPWRRIVCSLFLVAAIVAAVGAIASTRAVGQRVGGNAVNIANKIAPWVIQHTAYGQQAEFFVVLADQADLS